MSAVAAAVYVLFAIACFRLIWVDANWDLALGEGLFTLLGGLALGWAAIGRRYRAVVAIAGTVPLVVWFEQTPFNSGRPFLVASLIAPAVAVLTTTVAAARRV